MNFTKYLSLKQLYFRLKKNLKISSLIRDSFWSLIGNIVGRGLSLVAGIVVARFLGKDLYGEYTIIRNTILTIGIFSSFGLGYTATKYVAELKNTSKQKLQQFIQYANLITLFTCSLMAVSLLVGANYIATKLLEAPDLANSLRLLAILIIFNGLSITQIGIIAGLKEFKNLAKVNSLVGVITFLSSLLFTFLYGFEGALMALLFAQISNWFINHLIIKKHLRQITFKTKGIDVLFLKDILKFSTPVALQEMTYSAYSFISNILLIKFSTMGELGMYNASMQWNAIILFIPGVLRNVILSHLSENNSDENAHNKILRTTIFINVLSTLIPVFVVLLASGLIQSFYGHTFDGLSTLISIAVFATVFISISNVYAQAYMSKGYNWMMFGIRVIRDGGTLLLFLSFVFLGVISGAKAMILSLLLSNILFLILIALLYKRIQ